MKVLNVLCPTCKKKFNYHESEFRPFCSDRCRLIDLGEWLSGSYTVPVEKLTDEETQTLEQLLDEKNIKEEDDDENDQDFS